MISIRTLVLLAGISTLSPGAPIYQETWRTGYQYADATGPHVLGYWTFGAGDDGLKDSSGKGNHLTLSGATLQAGGHSGGGLRCGTSPTQQHSARAGNTAALSPTGPFTLEMWILPDAAIKEAPKCHLMDKRYTPENHTDYAWTLTPPEKSGLRRMALTLGFGASSETFHSEPLELAHDKWQHLAVTYDAAGTVTFYRDGSLLSQLTKPGLGAIKPGSRPLHIGDRVGSIFGGFPGMIDDVRITSRALRFEGIDLHIHSPRQVWQRMEQAAPILITCTNLQRQPTTGAKLLLSIGEKSETIVLPTLAPGATHQHTLTLDTRLKPATYTCTARLESGPERVEKKFIYRITPRPTPGMPVILWGGGDIPRMQDIGFTHYMALGVGNQETIWKARHDPAIIPPAATPETIAQNVQLLDEALAASMSIIPRVSPRGYAETLPGMLRIGRDGKPLARHAIMALHPDLPPFYEKAGRSLGATYGSHPAMSATLVNTEVRDSSQPSFSKLDQDAYRAFAGTDIPAEISSRSGVDWKEIPDFPADRVVADDHPVLKYCRWFWTVGDGWNALHSALSDGVKASSRKGHWTFFDPAVRQPSISGAGGNVDVLSHWTYTYPDPQRIGLATDQLLAMSEASGKGQHIMKMTQLIWYRSQTAPTTAATPAGDPVPWIDQDPDAAYITIAPMHLREAFWTKISRPVTGIMYHGWQSLVPTASTSAYKFTNPSTAPVLKELIHEVIRPLGPTLMAIPDERAEVALLESFTSQMFSKRGGYGYNNGWPADLWLALQHAHVRTDILFEETLLKDGLTGRKILVMPDCDVLSASIVARIKTWQAQGGKIIADENLCPALKADLVIPIRKRSRNAVADKAQLLAIAADLAPRLPVLGYAPQVTADSPEIILRTRRAGEARYLFAINDHREPGTYVGQYGLVMENGLPTRTTITLPAEIAAVYDLTRSQAVPLEQNPDGKPSLPLELGPCDGRILMLLPAPIQRVAADLPPNAKPGGETTLKITILDSNGRPMKAVIPLRIRIRDANGNEAESSGYHAATDGQLTLPISIAPNDDPGTWEIRTTELASGKETSCYLSVKP